MQVMINECPFCFALGATVRIKESKGDKGQTRKRAFVQCPVCHARGSSVSSSFLPESALKEHAIKAWNR